MSGKADFFNSLQDWVRGRSSKGDALCTLDGTKIYGRDLETARLTQEREIETLRAAQRAEVARERATGEQEAERAQDDEKVSKLAAEQIELSSLRQGMLHPHREAAQKQ